MNRTVRGSDGRMWNVRANIEWSEPEESQLWDHDVAGGPTPAVVMGGILLSMVFAFILWTPPEVYVSEWVLLALAGVILFFPVRWLIRRPWTLIAETPGDYDEYPPERWVGIVRGYKAVRYEGARVSRDIEVYAQPDSECPLTPRDH